MFYAVVVLVWDSRSSRWRVSFAASILSHSGSQIAHDTTAWKNGCREREKRGWRFCCVVMALTTKNHLLREIWRESPSWSLVYRTGEEGGIDRLFNIWIKHMTVEGRKALNGVVWLTRISTAFSTANFFFFHIYTLRYYRVHSFLNWTFPLRNLLSKPVKR